MPERLRGAAWRWVGMRRRGASSATLAQGRPARRSGPGPSVIGFDDLRRRLDDEDFFAAVGFDLDDPVQKDPLVVFHGDDAVDEDVLRERLVLRGGRNAGLQGLDVPAMQLHRRPSPCGSRRAESLKACENTVYILDHSSRVKHAICKQILTVLSLRGSPVDQ